MSAFTQKKNRIKKNQIYIRNGTNGEIEIQVGMISSIVEPDKAMQCVENIRSLHNLSIEFAQTVILSSFIVAVTSRTRLHYKIEGSAYVLLTFPLQILSYPFYCISFPITPVLEALWMLVLEKLDCILSLYPLIGYQTNR